jgi:hypothetical protein
MQFGASRWSAAGWSIAMLAAVIRWVRLAARHPAHDSETFAALVGDPLRQRRAAWPAIIRRIPGGSHGSVPQH